MNRIGTKSDYPDRALVYTKRMWIGCRSRSYPDTYLDKKISGWYQSDILHQKWTNAYCKQLIWIFLKRVSKFQKRKARKNCSLVKRTRWKANKHLENLCSKFPSLFGCDRPGFGGNVDVLQCEIAFENNEGMPETFRSECIVTEQRKLLTKVFEDCEKKRKQSLLARDHRARAHKIFIRSV